MSNNLNFNPHIILRQPGNANTSPNRLMVRHVLCKIANHGSKRLVVDRHMIRVHAEDLIPAFAASVFQVVFDVVEGLVDLRVDLFVEFAGFAVPAAW